MAVFSGLALLPDIDVFGVAFGLPDEGPLGHRGFTHSLLFAVAVAVTAGLCARRLGVRPWPTALLAFLAVGSHGLLDALTYDSRGTPLFWPLSDMRVSFPWRPIPGAPTGLAFLSTHGFMVAAIELIYFAPVVLMALFWRRAGAPSDVTVRCAAFRCGAIGSCVVGCLLLGETVLRDTRLVAWLERPSLAKFAATEDQRLGLSAWRQLKTSPAPQSMAHDKPEARARRHRAGTAAR